METPLATRWPSRSPLPSWMRPFHRWRPVIRVHQDRDRLEADRPAEGLRHRTRHHVRDLGSHFGHHRRGGRLGRCLRVHGDGDRLEADQLSRSASAQPSQLVPRLHTNPLWGRRQIPGSHLDLGTRLRAPAALRLWPIDFPTGRLREAPRRTRSRPEHSRSMWGMQPRELLPPHWATGFVPVSISTFQPTTSR